MTRTDTQLKFRIPPDLKPKLEKAARANKRSVNMEIIARLEQSFKAERQRVAGESAAAAQNLGEVPQSKSLEDRLEEVEKDLVLLEMRITGIEEQI